MGATIHYTRPDGRPCQGYYASPASRDRAAGIVVIQEWWGVNDQSKGVAERLVAMGYRALVADLYRGEVTVEAAEAEHLMNGLDFMDATTQDIQGGRLSSGREPEGGGHRILHGRGLDPPLGGGSRDSRRRSPGTAFRRRRPSM